MALHAPSQRLMVEQVSASPPGLQKILLHDIAFKLEAGQGLALMGASGSGKSSLVRLPVGGWRAASR